MPKRQLSCAEVWSRAWQARWYLSPVQAQSQLQRQTISSRVGVVFVFAVFFSGFFSTSSLKKTFDFFTKESKGEKKEKTSAGGRCGGLGRARAAAAIAQVYDLVRIQCGNLATFPLGA